MTCHVTISYKETLLLKLLKLIKWKWLAKVFRHEPLIKVYVNKKLKSEKSYNDYCNRKNKQ
jgi:hypothetical protein